MIRFLPRVVLIGVNHPRHRPEHDGTVEQRQAQIFQTQLSSAELAHQETLIQERETEIREIETGIHELHEIFRDLGTIVHEQGEMLGSPSTHDSTFLVNHLSVTDNIENNVSSIAVDTSGAAEELTAAHEYQRKAGRRAACLGIVLIIVVVVVLLAVRVALWVLRRYLV